MGEKETMTGAESRAAAPSGPRQTTGRVAAGGAAGDGQPDIAIDEPGVHAAKAAGGHSGGHDGEQVGSATVKSSKSNSSE